MTPAAGTASDPEGVQSEAHEGDPRNSRAPHQANCGAPVTTVAT
jgi:hypothetical protein